MKISRSFFACIVTFVIFVNSFGVYAQMSDVLLQETFDEGTTALEFRLNKADGTRFDGTDAIENGVLTVSREKDDGLQLVTGAFPMQTEGTLILSLDVKSNMQTGRLFALSAQPLANAVSVTLENSMLVLWADEKSASAVRMETDRWYRLQVTMEFHTHTVTLAVDDEEAAAALSDAAAAVGLFEIALTSHIGYLSVDNIYVYNTEKPGGQFTDTSGSSAETAIRTVTDKGIMTGMGDGIFSPDTCLTRAQMAQIVMRTLNLQSDGFDAHYKDVQPDEWFFESANAVTRAGIMEGFDGSFSPDRKLNFEEAAKIVVRCAEYGGVKQTVGGVSEVFDFMYIGKGLTDDESVTLDADLLQLEEKQMIYDDLSLPTRGSFGSDIAWQSSSDAVDSSGVLKRPADKPAKAELTATISKGESRKTKTFSVHVMPCNVSWRTTPVGSSDNGVLVGQTGDSIHITYDVTPGDFPLNTVMGFSSEETVAAAFTQMPVIVRFNEQGYIDAYNGSQFYMADKKVNYVAGTQYTIRLSINLSDKRYSVWVKEAGRTETQIAENYQFRSSADVTENIGRFYIKAGGTVSGDAQVTRMSAAAPSEVVGAESYNYSMPTVGQSDAAFDKLRTTHMVTEGLSLPGRNAQGRHITWVSSNSSLFDDNGALVGSVRDNLAFKMTAIIDDGSYAACGLISQKDAISDWAFDYVASAVTMGLVRDVLLEENFTPKMMVTRGYAAVLVERLLHVLP